MSLKEKVKEEIAEALLELVRMANDGWYDDGDRRAAAERAADVIVERLIDHHH